MLWFVLCLFRHVQQCHSVTGIFLSHGTVQLATACCVGQAAEAQERVNAWQQDVAQQQSRLEAALSSVQDHVRSSIQACRLNLAQLQHWLTHPAASRQQQAVAVQTEEGEMKLAQLQREAEACQIEARQVIQQLSPPAWQDADAHSDSDSDFDLVPGTATPPFQIPNSSSDSSSDSDAAESDETNRQCSSNGTAGHGPSMHSTADLKRRVGSVSSSDSSSLHIAEGGAGGLLRSARQSRGRSVWQPASGASSSTATMTRPASTITSLRPR